MKNNQGIITTSMFGESTVAAFRRIQKEVKEVQTLTDQSLHSILFNGDLIPHIGFGKLFRISLGRPSDILAISTRYGPVVMKIAGKAQVEVLVNRALETYLLYKRSELNLSLLSTHNAFVQFVGYKNNQVDFKNIGEMVELAQTHQI